ncbi:tRNA (N(6)-L-threonylcarbamoyladenosine(37)-C(2))-methylthiotransferase [Aeropyrum camini]|uniref:tRNA-t(6)A37 methylthiotransferase n=1 Tax=Aeropyrum camini SY1 = JCM 12091 TaxID=1198449 RepID=U3TDC7_9CREN|nr:tRNA (N(6)-L-threonylcarbamoyladenosine(37)-C(2))-methylthiotransferase [Aeropyrum camini]BAN90431.1 MiaB-like protein [Aeropyrum camini SY1 = JCM 12091]
MECTGKAGAALHGKNGRGGAVSSRKYYLEVYGCSLSEFDALIMASRLEEAGYRRVERPEDADVILVNTCAVRLDTEQRIAERLEKLRLDLPDKKYVVAGCLVRARPGLVARLMPEASLLAPQAVERVLEAVESLDHGRRLVVLEGQRDTSSMPPLPVTDAVVTVMIQEGCLGDCSFCITKVARRQVKSYSPRIIVERVREAVERGAREIRLTGTDVAVYGVDLPGRPNLADLVATILEKVEGDYRIRIGMMTPDQVEPYLDSLLDVYRDERVYKYFHLPVQSGDDEVLKIMKRNYTVEEYKAIHRKIKSRFPDAMVATDIIVGHPGETWEAFWNTVRLVKELRFEKVHLAQYSLRPHTEAASMEQVPDSVKKERSRILGGIVAEIGLELNKRYVGRRVRALVAERSWREGSMTGRLDNYTPIVLPYSEEAMGRWVYAEVEEATFFDLRSSRFELEP